LCEGTEKAQGQEVRRKIMKELQDALVSKINTLISGNVQSSDVNLLNVLNGLLGTVSNYLLASEKK
jgi:hypothetical protein